MDPESVLGLTPEANFDQARMAYLSLSKKYHPDKNAGVPSEELIKVQHAWELIKRRHEEDAKRAPPQDVDIGDMEFDEATECFRFNCRCGDAIVVSTDSLSRKQDLATCPSCSLRIRVLYEMDV